MKPISNISVEFVIDYELNGYISFGRRFMLFSMGYEHEMVCGEFEDVKSIPLSSVEIKSVCDFSADSYSYKIKTTEFWCCTSLSKSEPTAIEGPSGIINTILDQI